MLKIIDSRPKVENQNNRYQASKSAEYVTVKMFGVVILILTQMRFRGSYILILNKNIIANLMVKSYWVFLGSIRTYDSYSRSGLSMKLLYNIDRIWSELLIQIPVGLLVDRSKFLNPTLLSFLASFVVPKLRTVLNLHMITCLRRDSISLPERLLADMNQTLGEKLGHRSLMVPSASWGTPSAYWKVVLESCWWNQPR